MMENSRHPVSFIATDVPDEARAFYTKTMGLELRETSPFALVFIDNGHVLRVQIVSQLEPAPYTVHGWQVANIARDVKDLIAKGVQFQRYPHIDQDRLGIWTTPDGNKIAWFADPSGNTLSLTQYANT
ncbi:MAG: VOC family protein [Aliishimia sp.]